MTAPARAHELLDELFDALVSAASIKRAPPSSSPPPAVKPADDLLKHRARHAIRRRGFAIQIGSK